MDFVGDFFCNCLLGYIGKSCWGNIDECSFNLCVNDVICVDLINEYNCSCVFGFIGRWCEINVDDCFFFFC